MVSTDITIFADNVDMEVSNSLIKVIQNSGLITALSNNGKVYSWGSSGYGQLWLGQYVRNIKISTQIKELENIINIYSYSDS